MSKLNVLLAVANGVRVQLAAVAGALQDLEQLVRQAQPTPKLNVQPRAANGARAQPEAVAGARPVLARLVRRLL